MIKERVVQQKSTLRTDKQRPVVIKWKGIPMIRHQSFYAAVMEIVKFANGKDLTKVGIIGEEDTGKSTIAETVAHCIHKFADVPFTVRTFYEDDLLNFKETLSNLKPANYILRFDDVSFLEGAAGKKAITKLKQEATKIRHLPGGQDVKMVLVYNYHYTPGFDKYLRQANFRFWTSCGDSEVDNLEKLVGRKRMRTVEDFKKHLSRAERDQYWTVKIGNKEALKMNFRNPWIPLLFYNGDSIREIIGPKRQWIDPICSTCAMSESSEISLEQFKKEAHEKFTESTFKAAVKLKLKESGIANTYSGKFVQAQRYLDRALMAKQINLEELAVVYGLKPTVTKLRKKLDGVLADAPVQ